MPNDQTALGHEGEKAAVSFLKDHGFNILEKNYRTKPAEIDIIAREKDCLCFIEVKTRASIRKGLPKESVTWSKQKKIILGATYYLKKTNQLNSKIRFDVVEVFKNNDTIEINLIKNAFQSA